MHLPLQTGFETLIIISGTYFYIESSSPRKQGDTARLLSPTLSSSTGAKCFTFWYHMYGKNIGSLTITAKKLNDNNGTLLWSKTVEEGNRWEQGEATIPSQTSDYQVYADKSLCGTVPFSILIVYSSFNLENSLLVLDRKSVV